MTKKKAIRGITVQVRNTLALSERAEMTKQCLRNIRTIFCELFADENFVTLLQAESATLVPEFLRKVLDEAESRHDIA